jgi:hypothetical protein
MSRSDYKNIYEGYLDNTGYNNRRVAERYGSCGSEPMPYEMNEGYAPYKDIYGIEVPSCGTIDTSNPQISCNDGKLSYTYKYNMNVGKWIPNLGIWTAEPASKGNAFGGSNCIDDTNFYPNNDSSFEKSYPYSLTKDGEPKTKDNWYISYDKNFNCPTTTPVPTTPAPTTPAPTTPATTTPKPTTPAPTTPKSTTPVPIKVVTTDLINFPFKGANDVWKNNDKVVVKSGNTNNVLRGRVSNIDKSWLGNAYYKVTITFTDGTTQTDYIINWFFKLRADNSNNSPATSSLRWLP